MQTQSVVNNHILSLLHFKYLKMFWKGVLILIILFIFILISLVDDSCSFVKLQLCGFAVDHLMWAWRPCQSTWTMELCRASQLALIEIQTGANEACNQIRAETLRRLEDRMGIRATRPQGAVAKYLEFTSAEVRPLSFCIESDTHEWMEKHVGNAWSAKVQLLYFQFSRTVIFKLNRCFVQKSGENVVFTHLMVPHSCCMLL